MKLLAAGFLICAVCAFPAYAQDGGWGYGGPSPGYGPPPAAANYNFYGPTTNYFGPPPPAEDYGPPPPDSGYYGAGYGYGGYDADDLPPAQAYDGMRLDPWHGYDPDYDNGY